MSNLIEFSKNELDRVLNTCTDDESRKLQDTINKSIMEIIEKYYEQGYTGYVGRYVQEVTTRLLDWKPLTPLTGEEDEWNNVDVGSEIYCQNNRCPSIFRDDEGNAYNVEGKIFSEDNGHTWYSNSDSKVYIEFPYTVPASPENVILDKSIERNAILEKLFEIFKVDKDTYTEDTKIGDIINVSEISNYIPDIMNTFNLDTFALDCDDSDELWQVVNRILRYKEEQNEED